MSAKAADGSRSARRAQKGAGEYLLTPLPIEAGIEAPHVIEIPKRGKNVEVTVRVTVNNRGRDPFAVPAEVTGKKDSWQIFDEHFQEVRRKGGGVVAREVHAPAVSYDAATLTIPAGYEIRGVRKLNLDATSLQDGRLYTLRGEVFGQVAEDRFVAVAGRSSRTPSAGSSPSLARSVAARIEEDLQELEISYARQGRSLEEIGSARELAQRMAAVVPEPSAWDAALGPFYDSARVAKMLGGISRQAVSERRSRRSLLGLKTADGAWVYPAFQFDRRNTVIEGLPAVLKVFASSRVDDWTIASWLISPSRTLDGRSVVEWLQSGRDPETAVALARDAARRFAQ